MRPGRLWFLVLVVSLVLGAAWSFAAGQEATYVDKETLRSWLGNPEVVIIDVRLPEHWQGSGKKIKGAVREDPNALTTWAASLPKDKKIVLYCTKGLTSARLAQQLLDIGFPQVLVLQGGWKDWEQVGYPTESK